MGKIVNIYCLKGFKTSSLLSVFNYSIEQISFTVISYMDDLDGRVLHLQTPFQIILNISQLSLSCFSS